MRDPDNLYLPRLRELLNISETESWGQDWDLIIANSEWVEQLLDWYEKENLNDNEKNILMQLIVASYDEKLNEDKHDLTEEKRLVHFLERDIDIHKDIFEYWARLHEPESEGWEITPMLRKIWFNIGENKL